jgi:chromosome segregation ATPase
MFAIVVIVVSVVALMIYTTISAKNEDLAYYEEEMHKYMNQLDTEVDTKAKELKNKDAEIAYYKQEIYKYVKQLKETDAVISYYKQEIVKQLKEKDAAIAARNVKIDYYRRHISNGWFSHTPRRISLEKHNKVNNL